MSTREMQDFTNTDALRANVIGLASAGFMMAFFGAAWWGWGVGGIQGAFPYETVLFFGILAIATLILVIGGILLLLTASHFPEDSSPSEQEFGAEQGKHYGMTFGLVFGLEILSIVLCSFLLNRFHHLEFLLPFVSIIVGIHFFPLARLFNVRVYFVTGALLVLASVLVILTIPEQTMIGNLHAWDTLVGSISAITLWLTGFYAEFLARNYLKQVAKQA